MLLSFRGVLFFGSLRKVGGWSDAAKGDVIAREASAPTAAIRIPLGSTSGCDTGERIAARFALAITSEKMDRRAPFAMTPSKTTTNEDAAETV